MATDLAANFVTKQAQKYPELASHYEKLHELYSAKLYHQLTKELHLFVFSEATTWKDDNMIELYLNFISKFEKHLSEIELSRIVVRISKQFKQLQNSLKFLDGLTSKFEENSVSWIIIQCEIAYIHLIGNLQKQCKTIIDSITALLDGEKHYYNHSCLYSHFYRVSLQYYKSIGDADKYLECSLLFLTHTTSSDLTKKEQLLLASDICLAALISSKCYDFSFLLSHEMISILHKTEHDWLYQIVKIFNFGKMNEWQSYCIKHEMLLQKHESICNNLQFLEQKIRLMSLVELVFQTPPFERLIPFHVISSQCNIQMDEVELILIRAFSLKLIDGIIDEIDKTVNVTNVVARNLQKKQINHCLDKVNVWIKKIDKCKQQLDNNFDSFQP